MNKYQSLMEDSVQKMNGIMIEMAKRDDSEESEEYIFNLVKETFSYDELVFTVCIYSNSMLEKTLEKHPNLVSMVELMKIMNNRNKNKE